MAVLKKLNNILNVIVKVLTEKIPLEFSDFPEIFNLQKFGSYHGCNNLGNYILFSVL